MTHLQELRTASRCEYGKLVRSPVSRVATATVVFLSTVVAVGGSAAALYLGDTPTGRKVTSMMTGPGWSGFTSIAAMAISITMMLTTGIVMAWSAGREFTEGTIHGFFAIPPRITTIIAAKVLVIWAWAATVCFTTTVIVVTGGILLGFPVGEAPAHGLALFVVGTLTATGTTPSMWAASRWRSPLAGIAITLALMVVSNICAGFGLGTMIPWAIPVLWATPGSGVGRTSLVLPALVSVVSVFTVHHRWNRLELGTA
ncbi:hypothetical protein HMPREF1531_01373 [Propionibacterium sp. oral taxon 192 str. F0372]|uniref:ABC transporter permease n=1 Tax=Propionibacterium sp. oral taxon 192 TaxID=671222 RepID=UPI0003543DC4|nr:ABC transporter permease [Propionibacterium sp. oral taxon 192]EPH03314.1 hypothetical protein HMPREF1531_01373 [Propionibacterium sp. oral taxon 192 str. F0372]